MQASGDGYTQPLYAAIVLIKPDSLVQFLRVELAQLEAEFCDRWL